MVKASVIIPAHQEEKYIADTLRALKNKNAEIIVVCNGCTDKTAKVARKFKVKVLDFKKAGVSMARNKGARAAKSDLLIFLDADIKVARGTIKDIIKSGCDLGTCRVKPNINNPLPRVLMWLKNLVHPFGFTTGIFFVSKKIFKKVKGFDETLTKGEDGKFVRKAKKITKFCVLKSYVYNNMRRFEKRGYGKMVWFWIKHFFNPTEDKYEVVR